MSYALARKPSSAPAAANAASRSARGDLRIGEPDDAFEREADRVADEVMAGGPLKRHWSLSGMGIGAPLQRKCACGGSAGSGEQCEECKKKEEAQNLQRKTTGPAETGFAPPIVHEVLKSPGQPLDQETREFFEPRFGYDFRGVRVHSDDQGAKSARAVGARAYTVGSHMVFDSGQFAPATLYGRQLLAHELTHTLQQSSGEMAGNEFGSDAVEITATKKANLARDPIGDGKNASNPSKGGVRTTGLTADEQAQLKSVREETFNIPPGKSTIAGILIDDDTGKRYPVESGESGGPYGGTQRGGIPRGPGEAFSGGAPTEKNIVTHIEGHAAAIMHEQNIKRATLLSPDPPCRVCSHPQKTPAVSTVLPPGSRLTVVYPDGAETFRSSALPPLSPKGTAPQGEKVSKPSSTVPPEGPEATSPSASKMTGKDPQEPAAEGPIPQTGKPATSLPAGPEPPAKASADNPPEPSAVVPQTEPGATPKLPAAPHEGELIPPPTGKGVPVNTVEPPAGPRPSKAGSVVRGVGGAAAQIGIQLLISWLQSWILEKIEESAWRQFGSNVEAALKRKSAEIGELHQKNPGARIYARVTGDVMKHVMFPDPEDMPILGPGPLPSYPWLTLKEPINLSTTYEPEINVHKQVGPDFPFRDYIVHDTFSYSIEVTPDPEELTVFKDRAAELITLGESLLSKPFSSPEVGVFLQQEGMWRTGVIAWRNFFTENRLEAGSTAMNELLNGIYGSRLKQIRGDLGAQ